MANIVDTDNDDSWREELTAPATPQAKPALRIADRDGRPDIMLTPKVHETAERMAEILRNDTSLYQRGGALAHVIREDETTPPKVARAVVDTPIVRDVPLSMLINRVSMHARCVSPAKKKGAAGWVDAQPPKDIVRSVLERGSWVGIRKLVGILEAPALRPDGTLVQHAGYDAATGYLYCPNGDFAPVSANPSHSDAVLSYARLADVFRDFPYVSPAHLSATVAAILTLLARPAIEGSTPCWFFDASAPRSGKSLQVDVIHLIVTGRPASRTTFPEQDEELDKVLAAYARAGAATVNLDNVARQFGGAPLDKVLTSTDTVDFRILGSTEMAKVPWRAVVFASGNHMRAKGDMLPRLLAPRLESPLENPEQRALPDLRALARSKRRELVHAALTLLRAYVVAGRPDQPGVKPWGGFEAWTRLIPHALVWCGAADPCGARRGLEGDEDADREMRLLLVQEWERMQTQVGQHPDGLAVKGVLATLYPSKARGEADGPPDGWDSFREAVEHLTNAKPGFAPNARQFGEALRRLKATTIAGKQLRPNSPKGGGGIARWRAIRVRDGS